MRNRPLCRGDLLDELIATVAILKSDAVPVTRLGGFLEYFGSAVDLLPEALGGAQIEGRPLLLQALGRDAITTAEADVEAWRLRGLMAHTILDPEYPSNLQTVFDKPPIVFIHGAWEDAPRSRAVAIVGTRAASTDGCKRAYRLAKRLAAAGVTIVSGLARGIDTFAHKGALAAGGNTVAVLGTGIIRRYPKENAGLADEIVKSGGALVSQFFPEQPPTKWTFPVRNLTMSGLSLATIVVEAGATSGAKMQAEAALHHGRPVFLPASLVESHEWARSLISSGFKGAKATLVASAEDVLSQLDLSDEADALVA